MKSIFFLLFTALCGVATGQPDCVGTDTTYPCCNGIVHTGPDAAVNNERPSFLNLFDWRTDDYDVYHPLGYYTNGSGGPLQMPNPFKTTSSWLEHINYYSVPIPYRVSDILDFHPESGWELIHRHLGYKPDETTFASALENRKNPYFILYNKHTGLFRVIATLKDDVAQTVQTKLELIRPNQNYLVSSLLGYYNNEAQTLDEESNTRVSSSSIYPGQNSWFIADFTVMYDPCVCNKDAKLRITFETITSASVTMNGRLIATSVPLNGSGTSPLLNGKNFLMGLLQDGNNVEAGMLTYHNIDSLVAKYKTPVGLTGLENKGISLLGDIVKNGLKGYNPLIDRALTDAATAIAYTFIDPLKIQEITGNDSVEVGVDFASKASSFFVTAITPTQPSVPNMSFIEGELKLTGQISTSNFNNADEIQLELPGSKITLTQSPNPNSDWVFYPAYNEALGVMGVLERPKVLAYRPETAYGTSKQDWSIFRRHYELGEFKYTFNPAVGVDSANTVILMSLSGRFKSTQNSIGNFHRIPDVDNSDSNLYATNFMAPECLHGYLNEYAYWDEISLAAEHWWDEVKQVHYDVEFHSGLHPGDPVFVATVTANLQYMADRISQYHPGIEVLDFFTNDEFETVISFESFRTKGYRYFADSIMQQKMLETDLKLKVLIYYTFEENQYGKVNKTLQNLTFNTNVTSANIFVSPPANKTGLEIPRFLGIDNTTAFYQDTIEAYDTIFIFGDNINWPSTPLVLRAKEILVKDPSVLDGADVTLQSGEYPVRGCRSVKLGQLPQNQVKSFCTSSSYRGDIPKGKMGSASPFEEKEDKRKISVQLFPNPSTGNVTASYEVIGTSEQNVSISIFDIFGRELMQPINTFQSLGQHQENIDLSQLSAGIYFVTVTIGFDKKTERLVLTK